MPRYSLIANKTNITISIDAKKRDLAREKGIQISNLLDEALTRELDPDAEKFYNKAVALQNRSFKNFINNEKLEERFDKFRYDGGDKNVLDKNKRKDRENKGSIEGI